MALFPWRFDLRSIRYLIELHKLPFVLFSHREEIPCDCLIHQPFREILINWAFFFFRISFFFFFFFSWSRLGGYWRVRTMTWNDMVGVGDRKGVRKLRHWNGLFRVFRTAFEFFFLCFFFFLTSKNIMTSPSLALNTRCRFYAVVIVRQKSVHYSNTHTQSDNCSYVCLSISPFSLCRGSGVSLSIRQRGSGSHTS